MAFGYESFKKRYNHIFIQGDDIRISLFHLFLYHKLYDLEVKTFLQLNLESPKI